MGGDLAALRRRVLQLRLIAEFVFVAMPARKKPDGSYQDIAHPIDVNARRMFEEKVLAEYFKVSGLSTSG